MVVRKRAPSVAIRRIILTHRAPLAVAQVGTPELPVFFAGIAGFDAEGFFVFRHGSVMGADEVSNGERALGQAPRGLGRESP